MLSILLKKQLQEVYGDGQTTSPARDGIPQVSGQIPPVIPPVGAKIPPVIPPVGAEIPPVSNEILPVEESAEEKILAFCATAKNILEIAEYLGYKDKKTVRKYLNPLIEQGRIARTIPDKPNSRLQKYVTIR